MTCGPADHPAAAHADVIVISSMLGSPPWQALPRSTALVWDLTDPIWCYMGDEAFQAATRRVQHVTVSSSGLRWAVPTLAPNVPVTLIHDRLPYVATSRVHEAVAVPTVIWFGYGFNRWPVFSGVAPLLLRLRRNGVKFRLQIVDDQSQLPLYGNDRYGLEQQTEYLPWSLDTMHARLCAADVALLPPFPGWAGTMKSDNRQLTAAWAGLPIAHGDSYDTLHQLLTDWTRRRADGRRSREDAEETGDIERSVWDWKALLARFAPITVTG